MMKIIKIFIILFLTSNWIFTQDIECSRTTLFGEVEICLPVLDGYQECYTNSAVKKLADESESPSNEVLGFYLNNQTHNKIDSLGFIGFDDYFKIYATKQIKDLKADKKILTNMEEVLSGNFISKNWDEIKKEMNEIENDFDIEIGKPTIIKNYQLNENSFTYVLLVKYQLEGSEPFTKAMTINGLLLNERLVWMAYYIDYDGKKSINELQEKSDYIVTNILDANTK